MLASHHSVVGHSVVAQGRSGDFVAEVMERRKRLQSEVACVPKVRQNVAGPRGRRMRCVDRLLVDSAAGEVEACHSRSLQAV